MSPDPFVHLHVASGYSLQYGASHPQALVERAAEQEMDLLALTDRDGTYGAVKFARACQRAGIRPVLGVDLALGPGGEPPDSRRSGPHRPTPVRGGAFRDLPADRGGTPRVTLLAHAGGPGGGRGGWAAICRLVSAVHLAGERGRPVATLDLLAPHLAGGDVVVLLGPTSPVGAAITRRRDDLALAALAPWREVVPPENLLLELVTHRLSGHQGGWGPGTTVHAAHTASLAHRAGLGTVLTNAVRYADRRDAPTVDVLDAARRLVALDLRHLDRRNAEGFLKSGKQMAELAEEICRQSGLADPDREGSRLLAQTRAVADRCALDPRADLGLGEVHLPELEFATGATRDVSADRLLRERCEAGIGRRYGSAPRQRIWKRLDDELETIRGLGYASYFLTVGDITDLIREMDVRCAARGSGAGSVVNYLLGISGVDPIRHHLLMERFLSPLRHSLPDIDLDVESARRLEVYEAILDRYGGERCVTVSMMDTYRVRHAVRDVGGALGMPPGEIDTIAKAFPHIRARDARLALRDLPELAASGLTDARLDLFFGLVERLDGLPRHIAMHPCGVLLSDATLLDRTPVEASYAGFPMSQFDKDDVEDLGLLKLDVLGIRMQSAMAHAVAEIARVDGVDIDMDDEAQVPFDDPDTYAMISAAQTLGVFQIESPGQRELVGKSGIESFDDIITDISLFRPGPVKSDMITPYLEVKQGWKEPRYLHDDLRPILGPTHGVVVFHEQVIEMIAQFAGVSNAEADELRRALGDVEGMAETRLWFFPRALGRGYPLPVVERVWEVLAAFASFGFCKAHAAAFALPTYQSAWLKAHWPAHFLAGVLTHDPGMYPKRLILDEARQRGITVLGLDVDHSDRHYAVERLPTSAEPRYAIRLALEEVKGITSAEVMRVRGGPAVPLPDRLLAARPGLPAGGRAAGPHRCLRPALRHRRGGGFRDRRPHHPPRPAAAGDGARPLRPLPRPDLARSRPGCAPTTARPRRAGLPGGRPQQHRPARPGGRSRDRASRPGRRRGVGTGQRPVARHPRPHPGRVGPADLRPRRPAGGGRGLRAAGDDGRRADAGRAGDPRPRCQQPCHRPLCPLPRRARGHPQPRPALPTQSLELLVAGVKVATQTPPVRSGRRVVFLTLDDATGPVDATFFEDAQGPYAATVFGSWLLVVSGVLRRTGYRGVSLRATGAWELPALHDLWEREGIDAVHAGDGDRARRGSSPPSSGGSWCTPAASRCRRTPTSSRPVIPSRAP